MKKIMFFVGSIFSVLSLESRPIKSCFGYHEATELTDYGPANIKCMQEYADLRKNIRYVLIAVTMAEHKPFAMLQKEIMNVALGVSPVIHGYIYEPKFQGLTYLTREYTKALESESFENIDTFVDKAGVRAIKDATGVSFGPCLFEILQYHFMMIAR